MSNYEETEELKNRVIAGMKKGGYELIDTEPDSLATVSFRNQTTGEVIRCDGWELAEYALQDLQEREAVMNLEQNPDKQNVLQLQIPKGLSKEEFGQTIQYFKENGARFDAAKKHWYISPGVQEKFQKYLETAGEKSQEAEPQKKAAAEIQEGEKAPERYQKATYMGYAYTKNLSTPRHVFGNSPEDILETLNKWNQRRTEGYTYDTCNIGAYNPETDKYVDFQKYDVQERKNITKLYLQIPKGLSKEEFGQTIQYFKESGARFSKLKKQWYITSDIQDKFQKYLGLGASAEENSQKAEAESQKQKESTMEAQKDAEKTSKPQEESAKESAKESAFHYIKGIDNQYVVDLKNGETLRIGEREVLERAGLKDAEQLSVGKILEAVEEKVAEHLHLISGEKYDITVGHKFEDNRCTIYTKNGQTIDLYGDQFNIHFPSLQEQEVKKLVADYMNQSNVKNVEVGLGLQIGNTVKLYLPEYTLSKAGFQEITGLRTVEGVLRDIDKDKHTYTVETETGLQHIDGTEVYNDRQAHIISNAIDKQMTNDAIDLISQPELSAAQMEQVYEGIRDGLSVYQVAEYANPSYTAWQMDVFRYGMDNGIPFDSIKETVTAPVSNWEDSRRLVDKMVKAQRNFIVKDIRNHGLVPEKQLVNKIEKLNGTRGKIYSIDDILSQDVKQMDSVTGELHKEITSEIRRQTALMSKATAPMQNLVPEM